MPHRVAVTGYGAITPLGHNVADTWNNLLSGVCGIGFITQFDTSDFDVRIAAEVKDFNPVDFIDPVTARYSDRFTQFALAASYQALKQSNLTVDDSNRFDIGVLIGTGIGGIATTQQQIMNLSAKGHRRVSPYTVPMMIADAASGQVSIKLGIRGFNLSLTSACATGTDAIGMAYRMVKHGEIKAILCGGADASITSISVAAFAQAGALSKNPDPKKACRPFDKDRDGFIMGEGAGILMLEDLDYARARGAQILAEITGYAATSDAYHVTKPLESGDAAAKAMEKALADAGDPQIDYINAHGTSTLFNDLSETRAIKRVFGEKAYAIPVSSTKSMHAHMLGAAGAVEAVICCKVVKEGIIPPTINLEHPGAECDLDYVPGKAREKKVKNAMSNSFGFGGHNSCLVVSGYDEH